MLLFAQLRRPWTIVYVSVCVWMFSASWSYDGYLVLRDGAYPFTWLPNIFASSVLYLSAGLFWNLQWREGRGVHFRSDDRVGFIRDYQVGNYDAICIVPNHADEDQRQNQRQDANQTSL